MQAAGFEVAEVIPSDRSISNQGTLVRTRTDEVSVLGRNTQGVRVIRTKEGEHLVGVERIDEPAENIDENTEETPEQGDE